MNWWQQQFTELLHLDWFDSLPYFLQKEKHPGGVLFILEQDTGVEPAFTAWEAVVLPIYESCVCKDYIKGVWKKQSLFVEGIAVKATV